MKTLLLILSLIVPSLAFSENSFYKTIPTNNGTSSDFKSGNNYRWNTWIDGTTRINGNNYSNGTSWNTTVERNGNMRGQDSKGNYWSYNDNSGMYLNYGTGEIRNKKYGW